MKLSSKVAQESFFWHHAKKTQQKQKEDSHDHYAGDRPGNARDPHGRQGYVKVIHRV
jgi:hypothetical protein